MAPCPLSDQDRHGAINLFCDNLRAYLDGAPLRNVIGSRDMRRD
jgi:hypothetical protein